MLACCHFSNVLPASTCLSEARSMLLQVTKGNDVVITIEKAKTDRNDKPFEDIKIVNIDVEKTS